MKVLFLLVCTSCLIQLTISQCSMAPDKFQMLNTPLNNPSYTITFDDRGWSTDAPYASIAAPSVTVFQSDAAGVYLKSGPNEYIFKTSFTNGDMNWDGSAAWTPDDGSVPKYYLWVGPDGMTTINFGPDIHAVSMRINCDNTAQLKVYSVDNDGVPTFLGCASSLGSVAGTNTYVNYGFKSKLPFSRITVGSVCYIDNIQAVFPLCNIDSCNANAYCYNNDANDGVSCTCNTGYTGDGFTCTDKNECNDVPSACLDPNSVCHNLEGSFECPCKTGFKADLNGTCIDINECDNSDCSPNAQCTNTPGSYNCTCNPGYDGDGKICADYNECEKSPCDPIATCTNYEGYFECDCGNGYYTNGTNCIDINECALLPYPCDANADCTNTVGSYSCKCKEGYEGTGDKCQKTSPIGSKVSSASPIIMSTVAFYAVMFCFSCDVRYV